MPISESMVKDIVQEVMAKMQLADAPSGKLGIFKDMNEAIEAAKKAQKVVRNMSLDQREKIISVIRRKTRENAELLARLAVDETGMGNVGHKILKNHLVADKTPGTEDLHTTAWSGDRGLTLIEMGPFGVIGAITPCTNPQETVICNTIGMLAGGNTVVFNPHPQAIKTSIFAINMLNEASLEAGGPANIAVTVENPTLDTSAIMMKHKDIHLIAATGGPGVVTAVLSSGKRGIGAGAGNPPALVDETADIRKAAEDIVNGCTFDNNLPCIAEKEVVAVSPVVDELMHYMVTEQGCYLASPEEQDKLTAVVMKGGNIEQIGSPVDIYNEPVNRYVANFIGESNITDGVMPCDNRVIFDGHPFDCVDGGFAPNEEVDVVIRPEDLDIVAPEDGLLRGRVKSVLFKGVHYDTIVETRQGTSITVKMNITEEKPVINEEAGELMDADSFYLDKEDVAELTESMIIARANAQAWKKDTEEWVSISKISYDIKPENGRYPVTFSTASGTTVTVDMIVEDANRVQSEEYQEEIYAVNFSKSVDDIRESMTLDNDLMVWADASAWSLAPEDEGARIKITDVIYDFDWENITPGVYDITFATKGSEYKVATTDRTEPGDLVGLRFTPDDIHIMRKGD